MPTRWPAGQELSVLAGNTILAANASGAAGTVVNYGTIEAAPGRDTKFAFYGVSLAVGGTVINAQGAYIAGVDIQSATDPGILLNAGTIMASSKADSVTNSTTGYIKSVGAESIHNSGKIGTDQRRARAV